MKKYNVGLGCGLIGIGRPWGPTRSSVIPSEKDAINFIQAIKIYVDSQYKEVKNDM